MPKKSILLLVCTLFVLSIGLSATGYAKKPDNGKGKGPPDKSAASCELNFCIVFDADGHELTSDGFEPGEYCHGTDKVLVFTGKGPGFGFDTTQSGKGKTMSRYLNIDLTAFEKDLKSFTEGNKEVELLLEKKVVFKFDKSGVPSGLDLCLLDELYAYKKVGLAISYEVEGATDNSNTLTYGAPGYPEETACGERVTVTRTGIEPNTWTIAGTKACLWDGQKDALVFKGERNRAIIGGDMGGDMGGLDVSFLATITEIP